jgi:PKD repeat protein
VAPIPVVNFSSTTVCFGNPTTFTNLSTISSGNNNYKWYFGNGDSATATNPIYSYSSPGNYQVKLIATSNLGFSKDTTIQVSLLERPVANFNLTNTCEGDASIFNNTTSFTSGAYTSLWNFGDGNTSTDQNPSHIYTNPQQYTVKLVVTGNNGCKDSVTKNTTMYPRPVAGYFESTNNICAHTDVSFFNSTTISVGTYTSTWTFGDGNSSTVRNPVHNFNATGTYQVKLLATSSFGCSDSVTKTITIIESPNTDFEVAKACDVLNTEFRSTTIVPNGFTASYAWNLNGQTTSSEMNPKHSFGSTGLKTISLEVTLNNGCKTSMTKQIDFKTGAKPMFSHNDFCGNKEVTFVNNSVSNASPGDITHRWNLGDGTIINTSNALVHTYNNSTGMFYEVKLMTSVSGECHDTLTKMVYSGEVAVCDFQIVPKYVPGHRGYEFIPDSTHYPSYKWDFGDQKSSTEVSPLHQYSADGAYVVKLEASSADNCKCELTFNHQVANLNVSEFNTYQGLVLYPNPTTGLLNIKIMEQSLQLTSVKVMDMAGKIISVLADNQFKDMESFELNVSHLSSGTYKVLFSSQFGQTAKRFVLVK